MRDLPSEDVASALHRFGLERDRLRTAQARRLGIAVADLDALEHLELAGPLTQRELAMRLLLSSGAVTFLVDRLEQAGLVRRQPHPTDRRTTLVSRPIPPIDAARSCSAASDRPVSGRRVFVGRHGPCGRCHRGVAETQSTGGQVAAATCHTWPRA